VNHVCAVYVVLQERSKALGYIDSNLATAGLKPLDDREAQRAPDNVNQLQVTIIQCKNVMSRRKGMAVAINNNNNSSSSIMTLLVLICYLTEVQ